MSGFPTNGAHPMRTENAAIPIAGHSMILKNSTPNMSQLPSEPMSGHVWSPPRTWIFATGGNTGHSHSLYTYTHTYVYKCTCIYIYICTYVYLCTYSYAYIYTYMYTWVSVYMSKHMYIHIYTCMSACLNITYVYVYIYIYVCVCVHCDVKLDAILVRTGAGAWMAARALLGGAKASALRRLFPSLNLTGPNPKGSYAAHLRILVPKTLRGIVFGTRVLKWAVYGPFGAISHVLS